MSVDKNLLEGLSIQPRTAITNVYKWLVSIVLILVSVSVTQVTSEKVARATELTCAEGGLCEVGDIGPGGGIVFYAPVTPFTSDASCGSNCKYLEMAPKNWYGGSSDPGLNLGVRFQGNLNTKGNTVIGSGFLNTSLMKTSSPVRIAIFDRQLPNLNGETDWFLPNLNEYLQIKAFLSSSVCTSGTRCVSYTTVIGTDYWTSHYNGDLGWAYKFNGSGFVDSGGNRLDAGKLVRPIRAFKSVVSTYVVSFDGNGSTGGSVPGPQMKTHGDDLTLASNSGSLVKTGYTFGGWNTAANGSGASYAVGATYGVDAVETLYAQWTANSLTVTYDSQEGSPATGGSSSTTTGGEIASAPVAPTRTGYVFTGWFSASTGGSAISFPYTHGRNADFTLYARWSQASLHGISSVSKIGTITTTANLGNTFAVDTESSSVSLRYPANGLPADTVIDVYLVNDLSRARSLVAPAGGFVVSLVVAWLAADGSVPLMASGKPLSMTIANDTIKAGAKTYAIVGGEVTLLGTASVNGSVTISIIEDPEIVIVNPVVVSQPSSAQPSASQPSSIARRNPVKVVELLPQVPGATSKIAAILNTVAGKLPPKPTVFAPKILSNGKIARIAFTPIQIKAPPANAPVAPLGAKIFPIGAKIEQSQVTPTAPVFRVAAGESKATFGGQTIETEMSRSANGPAILSAGPATIALAGFADEPAASSSNTGGSTGLTASSSTPLEIATGSFIASTPVQVWLFSTPLLLAETAVDENGNFAAAISLPSSIPAGNHTLQIQGFVYAAGGAAEVTANIGVSIAAPAVGTRWSGTFPMYVASITPSVKSQWTKFVSAQNSTAFACSVTPVKPERNSKANIRLYENRLIAMTTMLKYNGCVSVETLVPSTAKKSSVANRTWTVVVQSQATTVAFRWVHDFSTYASTINPAQKATWTALSTDFAGQKLQCVITGSEPIRNSLANARIFANRNENMKAYLLKNGCSEVQINKAISAKTKLASRTKWRIEASVVG